VKQIKFALTPIAIAIAFSGVAMAQSQNVSNLNTVVITGKPDSMTQSSVESAKDNMKTIPGGASIVDLNQVREGRQSTWSDSLGMAPGVFIQDRFGSEEARLAIRGSGLSRTYHGFGTKVMQDGVPINYADGMFDMQTLDPNASRYVEVLRGPNATTYGATTLGGAINFVLPRVTPVLHLWARLKQVALGTTRFLVVPLALVNQPRRGATCGTTTWLDRKPNKTDFDNTLKWKTKSCWPILV